MAGKRYQCGVSTTLDSSRWIKLSSGLDDFRFGPPRTTAGRIVPASPAIIVGESPYSMSSSSIDLSSISSPSYGKGYSKLGVVVKPSLTFVDSRASTHTSVTRTASSRSRRMTFLSTKKPTSPAKKKYRGPTLEQKLRENPLLLLPYLEADIPHEVFVKLMGIMGPSQDKETDGAKKPEAKTEDAATKLPEETAVINRKLYSRGGNAGKRGGMIESMGSSPPVVQQAVQHLISGDLQDQESIQTAITEQLKEIGSVTPRSIQASMVRQTTVMDPYRSFLKRVNFSTTTATKKKTKTQPPKVVEEEEELNPRHLAENFCSWLSNMGGEENKFNMDADKILTLFAMDADLQPTAMLTTSHVLEEFPLSANERAERLRKSVMSKGAYTAQPQVVREPKKKVLEGPSKPVRYRYGAWYLDINQWKKLGPGEQLEDPEEIETTKRIEAARCTNQLDDEISNLHGYKALMSYIYRTGQKVPNFLKNVRPPTQVSKEEFFPKTRFERLLHYPK